MTRRRKRWRVPAPRRRRSTPAAPGEQLVPRRDDPILVEADGDGTFLLCGSGDLTGLDVLPLSLIATEDRDTLGEAIATTVGHANVAAQALHGVNQVRGLVRLAPETLKALRSSAQPLVKGGWNLGTLARDGKFVHQVRWLPVESAGAVGILASIGPAAALVAIQWQLAQVVRLIEQNIAVTNEVLKAVRTEQWAEVRAHHDNVLAALRHTRRLDAITPEIWEHLQAQSSETALRKNRQLFFEHVQLHAQSLPRQSGARARHDWLSHNAEAVLRDVDALLMAERAWFVYQALRAAALTDRARVSEPAAQLQRCILEEARAAHADAHAAIVPLLEALYRHFRLMEECPGGVGLALRGRKKTPAEVAEAARALAGQVGALAGWGLFEPHDAKPVLSLSWDDLAEPQSEVARRLRWILGRGEKLLAIVYGYASTWIVSSGYIAFTSRRILLLKQGAFLREGLVDRETPWASVTEIRRSEKRGPYGGPELIVTSGEGYSIWLTKKVAFEEIDALVETLRGFVPGPTADDNRPAVPGLQAGG